MIQPRLVSLINTIDINLSPNPGSTHERKESELPVSLVPCAGTVMLLYSYRLYKSHLFASPPIFEQGGARRHDDRVQTSKLHWHPLVVITTHQSVDLPAHHSSSSAMALNLCGTPGRRRLAPPLL